MMEKLPEFAGQALHDQSRLANALARLERLHSQIRSLSVEIQDGQHQPDGNQDRKKHLQQGERRRPRFFARWAIRLHGASNTVMSFVLTGASSARRKTCRGSA